MALFSPFMEFEFVESQISSFEVLCKCHLETLSNICIWLCLSKCINGIISKISQRNLEILFAQGSHESLKRLEDKTREGPFFQGSIWKNISVLYEHQKVSCTFFFMQGENHSQFKIQMLSNLEISEKLSGNCNFLLICMQKQNWDERRVHV